MAKGLNLAHLSQQVNPVARACSWASTRLWHWLPQGLTGGHSGSTRVPWASHHTTCAFYSAWLCQCGSTSCHLCWFPLSRPASQPVSWTPPCSHWHLKELLQEAKKSLSPNSEECSLIFFFLNFIFSCVILQAVGSQPRSSAIFTGGLGAQLL